MKANKIVQWILRGLLVLAVTGSILPVQSQPVLASSIKSFQPGGVESSSVTADGVKDRTSLPISKNDPAAHVSRTFLQASMTTGETIRASVDLNGVEGNGNSGDYAGGSSPSISVDGRYVAFESSASNLVSGDTNGVPDVFMRDTQANTTTRISLGSGNAQGNSESRRPSISADGRYVTFYSSASNLVSGDTNGTADVFVRDTKTNTTTRISFSSSGAQGNNFSVRSSISADGRYVAFESYASNLVSGDTNGTGDVFVRDTQTNTTTRISLDSSGVQGNLASTWPSISADGRYVAFRSGANNLVSGDTNGVSDTFVRDTQTNITTRVSLSSSGAEGNGASGEEAIRSSTIISTDGRYVAFGSTASNLVSDDTNGAYDVFVRDTVNNATIRASVASNGVQGNSDSIYGFSISADGRYVAFSTAAYNLADGGDTNGLRPKIVVRDTVAGITTRASIDSNGVQGGVDSNSFYPTISGTGVYVVFLSTATNLVSGDENGMVDVFVHKMDPGELDGDADGDGLLNAWETQGYARIVDGQDIFVDLPAMGSDPYRKDIFVEIDYMEDSSFCLIPFMCSKKHTHQPKPEAIAKIVNAFTQAPVSNPDGSTGINLHVDNGPGSEMNPVTHAVWGNLSQSNSLTHKNDLGEVGEDEKYRWKDFDSIKKLNFSEARAALFHYNVFAHRLGELGTTSGIARGSDFIVSLYSPDSYTSVGSINEQAGTFMHELGHNLGFRHSGDADPYDTNLKPNYLSVMNYSFQMGGLIINGKEGNFDYSRFALPVLNENNLDETIGLDDRGVAAHYGTRYWCSEDNNKLVSNIQSIDWNCDGDGSDIAISENINEGGGIYNHDTSFTELTGFDDWANIEFTGGSIGASGANWEPPASTQVTDHFTLEDDALLISNYKVRMADSGNASLLPGDSTLHTFTLTNLGINSDTYTISASSSAGWADLSGIPASLTLAAGASIDILVTVNIPVSSIMGDKDVIDLSAVSQANMLISDKSTVVTTVLDTLAPSVNSITAVSPSSSFKILIPSFQASDNVKVIGYMITESPVPPAFDADGWAGMIPTSYAVSANGTHLLYPWVKDTAGNVSAVFGSPVSVMVDNTVPIVISSIRAGLNPVNTTSVDFTVTFSEFVGGVDTTGPVFDDFILSSSVGISGASVMEVVGSNASYTVTVNTGSGNGTIRLDVADDNSIVDIALNPLGGAEVGDGDFMDGEVYSVIKSATFVDVPLSYSVWGFIERLYSAGITGGCSAMPMMYCPDNTVTRAQMAVFLLRGIHGSTYAPPAVGDGTGFADVPVDHPMAAWIKQLAAEGITGGCGNGNYCPSATVTRAQMAVFLLRSKYTSAYTPPSANGDFTDVPIDHPMAAWIEQLAAEGITGGCGSGTYCPDGNVTRAQMAVFLVRNFNLP